MRLALKLHPDSQCRAVNAIAVEVVRAHPAGLTLRYAVSGTIGDVAPAGPADTRARRRALAAHVLRGLRAGAAVGGAITSSTFPRRRDGRPIASAAIGRGMTPASEIGPARHRRAGNRRALSIDGHTGAGQAGGPAGRRGLAAWRCGGHRGQRAARYRIGRWRTRAGKADFHHSDCFAHELPTA